MLNLLQRAEVRCSIETPLTLELSTVTLACCSARKCAALLRRGLAEKKITCPIQGLQRAEVRCSIETWARSSLKVASIQMLQRAEVRCSIETSRWPQTRLLSGTRCSARKCAALLRHEEPPVGLIYASSVAARGSALLY